MEIRDVQNSLIKVNQPDVRPGEIRKANTPTDKVDIGGGEPVKDGLIKLNVLHMNDVHGAVEPVPEPGKENVVGGLAEMQTVLNKERAKNPDGTLTLNAGDLAEGSLVSYFSRGEVVTEAFNKMGFDAIELGNHDFSWGQERLKNIIQDLDAPILGANITEREAGRQWPAWFLT